MNRLYIPISRPNGNLSLKEVFNGRVINKIVQKGDKHFLTSFDKKGKMVHTTIFENKPKTVLYTNGQKIDITNNRVKYLSPDRPFDLFTKFLYTVSDDAKKYFKVIKKSDGKKYLRMFKPKEYKTETNLLKKLNNKVLELYTENIKLYYAQELLKRK